MRKSFFISCFLISIVAFGQKMPADYFDEASKFFEEEKLEKALNGFQYIVDNHPKNEHYPKAFYNVAYIHFLQEDYDKAIKAFKAILQNDFNETERLGGGIMDDPYTNYKHRSSEILSEIYYKKNKFDIALQYFILSDISYPYIHFCGNEYASNNVHTALRYAKIYQKLNQPDKAIEKLLPIVFITLTDNSEVIKELKKLLVGRKGLKQELDKSLDNIYSQEIEKENYSYTRYYFKFLNIEIDVSDSYDEEEFNKDEAKSKIMQTTFYKMIKEI